VGHPPQDPRVLKRTAYAPFVALVRASMRNCGALRLDHVHGAVPASGGCRAASSPPTADTCTIHWKELLGVVALESHRQQCLVVGEDLGVVPDEIRRALPQFGVYHYKVVMFEQRDGEFVAPADYVRHALATVTTHDLPTLHGWWSGHDIDLWEKLGFYPDAEVATRNREERVAARERLLRALRGASLWPADDSSVPEFSDRLARAVHAYLGRTRSALVTVQLEDMIGMLEPVNVPGTSSEYSNWTRRMTASATDIFSRAEVRALAATMCEARQEPTHD
jgi:4-alpha-glucanotransferase